MVYLNKEITELARIVSEKRGIPLKVVMFAYKAYCNNITSRAAALDLENAPRDMEPVSFNLKHIGKLYAAKEVVNKVNDVKNK